MEYMLIFTERAGAGVAGPERAAAMKAAARELEDKGKLRRDAALAPATGARIRVRDGTVDLRRGPVVENEQMVTGFWIVDVKDRAEAVEIARQCPHNRYGVVEARGVSLRESSPGEAAGKRMAFIFRMEPGLTGDESKLREMLEFQQPFRRESKLIDTAPLNDERPARVETRGGKMMVTDGPFAETKEGVGGYSIVILPDLDSAVELAKRYPHARWGPVEVREVV